MHVLFSLAITRASGYYFYSYDSTEVFNPNSLDPNNLIYHHDPNSGCPTSIKNITVNRLAQEIVFINKRPRDYSSSCAGDDLTKTTVEICEVKVMGKIRLQFLVYQVFNFLRTNTFIKTVPSILHTCKDNQSI